MDCFIRFDYFTKKCFPMFYSSSANSLVCYGSKVYGAAVKKSLTKKETSRRSILRATFVQKIEFAGRHFNRERKYAVFELGIIEIMETFLKQLRCEAPTHCFDDIKISPNQYATGWNLKGLLLSEYHRTVVRTTSL